MARSFFRMALCAVALTGALTGHALAQSYPTNFAPRCQPDELRVGPRGQDACTPRFAFFGLKGPTVAGAHQVEVEATGSIPEARPSTGSRRAPR